MSEPIIADNAPVPVSLNAGEDYHWCVCGRSQNQPFCDGSHVDTEFTPVGFTADADSEAYLCACKRTGNPPFCDGTRAQFGDELGSAPTVRGRPQRKHPSLWAATAHLPPEQHPKNQRLPSSIS